ncbi:hypothetical protein [Vibrio barjaei]|uniref:hypothetical protein n=1 Tax=Vibrio barjaei TaxID=1676683 RepID=UPI002284F502|nr:hypothetical protein [Vibrio barjaei]MCY9870400.1 hypothetical protein [Vibrio barjaei]
MRSKKSGGQPSFQRCVACDFNVFDEEHVRIDCIYPLNRERTEWNCYCNPSLGGCGRVVYGRTQSEIAKFWNDGDTSEVIV